ncbi:MAG: hypothetical protein ABJJ39_11470, partial [Kangiellaceae bacterium]
PSELSSVMVMAGEMAGMGAKCKCGGNWSGRLTLSRYLIDMRHKHRRHRDLVWDMSVRVFRIS